MKRERGSIALYLLFSLAAAIATGYAAYRVIREQRLQSEAMQVASATRPAPARPLPAPRPLDPLEPTPDVDSTPPVTDAADLAAVDPDDFEDPEKDTVVYGIPGIAGALTIDAVSRTVKRYANRFDRCLRKTREQYSVRRATVRVTVDVDAQGKVLLATAKLQDAEQYLAECVLDVFRKLRFDAPSDRAPARIVYPIVFAPANGGADGNPGD
jgi:hypothetical protein